MKRVRRQQGFSGYSIIEVILTMLLVAIALPPLLHLFANVNVSSSQANLLPFNATLASTLMEEVKSKKFDELDEKDADGNWSTVLTADAGETANNKATFDDVDDFNGWVEVFDPNLPQVTGNVTVGYVASNDLDTLLAVPQPAPNDWTPSYKRISVTVTQPGYPGTLELVTVVTEAQSL